MCNCGAYDRGSKEAWSRLCKAAIFVPPKIHLKSVAVDGWSEQVIRKVLTGPGSPGGSQLMHQVPADTPWSGKQPLSGWLP